ncbi:hypothetical protein BCR34DRAFT_587297 [Clohesyomyces aquaticus]|uniref:Uncharacterized protein n=1 Tax=Clohesyomyces aquaticus TaxID=1231657 RepID=A0A1Y1ZQ08_9PLEO|nr:hypothetical protein BCR34DRAFT_587297 [Clohesyomyces aquaticus]
MFRESCEQYISHCFYLGRDSIQFNGNGSANGQRPGYRKHRSAILVHVVEHLTSGPHVGLGTSSLYGSLTAATPSLLSGSGLDLISNLNAFIPRRASHRVMSTPSFGSEASHSDFFNPGRTEKVGEPDSARAEPFELDVFYLIRGLPFSVSFYLDSRTIAILPCCLAGVTKEDELHALGTPGAGSAVQ